jgi:hypothetical protein
MISVAKPHPELPASRRLLLVSRLNPALGWCIFPLRQRQKAVLLVKFTSSVAE